MQILVAMLRGAVHQQQARPRTLRCCHLYRAQQNFGPPAAGCTRMAWEIKFSENNHVKVKHHLKNVSFKNLKKTEVVVHKLW